ncbi:IS3 family transposase [Cecembia sp.]|uniref:IS3 family transposase n=1 Tax=Cecembia sp. TaxID=1898110 RepID=UPI0025C2E9ED|nr:IS3 family transposase [Cecembia sp.]
MSKRERRKFDEAFKRMAVELHLSGKTSTSIGKELGIGADLVRRWTREFKSEGATSFPGNGKQNLTDEQKEILALKKELNETQIERDILKKAGKHLFQGGQEIYGFMKDHRHEFAVEKMCRVFNVSRSGYYNWLKRKPSKREQERELLLAEIDKIHTQSNGRYGSPKITIELRDRGFSVSRPRVARIMRANGIRSVISRKFRVCTTDSNHGFKINPNLLERNFSPDGPAKSWVSDITYIRTEEGWLYLTMIMDLYDRKIIGWSMSTTMHAENTVIPAWRMAQINRPFFRGLVFHSDRGVQYACFEFRKELDPEKVSQSMSRKANCWDNAVAENFFKILKSETGYRKYDSIAQAKQIIFEFIEIWYNRIRRHSSLGYLSPEQFGKTINKIAL